jgi:hypothetical protein
MKYIFHFVDSKQVMYESVFKMIELMIFLQQAQSLRLKSIASDQDELVNFKYVMRIEEFVDHSNDPDDLPY